MSIVEDTTHTESVGSHGLSGLSDESRDQYASERLGFMQELASTPEGRKILRQGFPDIDLPAQAVEREVRKLSDEVEQYESAEKGHTVLDAARTNAASIAIWDVYQTTRKAAAPHRYRSRTKWFRRAKNVHQRLDSKMLWRQDKLENWKIVADLWGWYGNVFSVVAFILILNGDIRIAAVVVAVRILITGACWGVIAFPGDDSPEHPVLDSDPRISILAHAGDMAIMFAIAEWLIIDNDAGEAGSHLIAGIGVWLASILMIMGTVHRMATSAPRLLLERMVRGASICGGLFLLSWSWSWAAIVVALGPVCFAWIEAYESWRCLAEKSDDAIASVVYDRFKNEDEPKSPEGEAVPTAGNSGPPEFHDSMPK